MSQSVSQLASKNSSLTFDNSEVLSAEIIQPEILLSQWTSASFVLLTTSLLFYHMTRVSSLEMNTKIAGILSVIMIIMSIIFEIQALVVYSKRLARMNTLDSSKSLIKSIIEEKNIGKSYVAVISVVVFVEIIISIVIIKGSFKKI